MSDHFMQLAQIAPQQRHGDAGRVVARRLSAREKAAVIVRLMLAEGAPLPIAQLPEHLQADLASQIGRMRTVDRVTLDAVISEFMAELGQVGLSFPGGLEGALSMMDGHISPSAAVRLRRQAGVSAHTDPWERIVALPVERLLPVLEEESTEVAAVMLSKLPVPKAAELLGRMPGEKARRVAYAVSMTGNVDPDTVRRIGISLATQLDNQPARAFSIGPVERVGAILNIAPQLTRTEVLAGLDQDDAAFADLVRKAIFTYPHIPAKLSPRDVPKVVRVVDQQVLVTALAASLASPEGAEATEFILANMSQRMAQGLREEMQARGKIKEKDAEAAMNIVISAIRDLEASGEVVLIQPED